MWRGIECTLIQTAHKIASGKKDIAVYIVANEGAGGFYEKCRMKGTDVVMKYNKIEWTEFKEAYGADIQARRTLRP